MNITFIKLRIQQNYHSALLLRLPTFVHHFKTTKTSAKSTVAAVVHALYMMRRYIHAFPLATKHNTYLGFYNRILIQTSCLQTKMFMYVGMNLLT